MTQPTADRAGPSFSIVVPTYGRPEPLVRCLRALSQQDYRSDRYEVVVVDDGSDEAAAPLISAACATAGARLERQARNGPAAARNVGAQVAQGLYLAFLDDDCEPSRTWLSLLASRFREITNAAIGGRIVHNLASNCGSLANQLHAEYMQGRNGGAGALPRFLASNNFAVPADLFRSVGGFDDSFRLAGSEDRDFCDRWTAAGHALLYEPRAIVLHSHPVNLAGFVRKHYEYGRGAFRFRHARARRLSEPLRVEPLRFYAGLVFMPLRHRPVRRAVLLAALLFLSQLANVAGFLVEALRARRRRTSGT